MVGLMVTCPKRAHGTPRRAAPEPLPLQLLLKAPATAGLDLRRRCSNTVLAWSLVGMGFDSKRDFASPTLAWKIPWMEEPGRLQSMGLLRVDTTERLPFHFSLSCIGEGNGNPLQCSCLENPRDGGAWWAAVYGVAQSQTQLK